MPAATAAAAIPEPMYATVGTSVPDDRPGDWAFEPRYDGIRVLAFASARGASLVTRNGKDKPRQFPEIVRALAALTSRRGHPLTLDGEIVALDRAGGAPARFQFSEWTSDGRLRRPIFLGVRDDKQARDVGRESTSMQRHDTSRGGARSSVTKAKSPARGAARKSSRSTSVSRSGRSGGGSGGGGRPVSIAVQLSRIEREGGDGTLVFEDGATLSVTSLDKPFWKKEGITKGALMRYYARVSPALLPAIADRPLALKRYPNGVEGYSFFQQNAGDHPPAGVRVAAVEVENEGKQPRLVGGDLPTLLYTVQLGTIAVNPWHSRLGSLDSPDYAILDLDPGPRVPFSRIVQVAHWVREELEALGLHGVAKTSGSRGIHVVIPLPRRTGYATSAALAEQVARRVARAHPREATVERSIGERPAGTIYVDHMQNARGKTLASVLSVRAKPGATVSTPVSWRQLTSSFDPHAFTLATVPGRLKRVAGIWSDAMGDPNESAAVRAASRAR